MDLNEYITEKMTGHDWEQGVWNKILIDFQPLISLLSVTENKLLDLSLPWLPDLKTKPHVIQIKGGSIVEHSVISGVQKSCHSRWGSWSAGQMRRAFVQSKLAFQ